MKRAMRALIARPGFALVVIATLAIGFGVNAAIFSITRSMLLRPLPYRDADRLVQVFEASPSEGLINRPVTPASYVAWRDRVDAFDQTAAFLRVAMNVSTTAFAVQVEAFRVAPSFFPLLGIEPAMGRLFTDEDARPGRDQVVVLNDGFWRRRFGGDPRIVGQSIDIDGAPCTVIGILPLSFRIFHILNHELDLFRPMMVDPNDHEQAINLWARLRPGATIQLARAELATAYATLPMTGRRWTGDAVLYAARVASGARPIVLVLESAVGLVLLIGCANIANLLLVAAAGRRKELAVRLALGATRWHVVRDLGSETLLLTIAGGAVAVVLSRWIVAVLNAVVSYQDLNRFEPFRVDGVVTLFTTVLAAAVAFAFGLLPLGTADALNVVDELKDSAPGTTAGMVHRRLRHVLVVGEVALAIVLAASAVVLTRSAFALHGASRGVTVDRVMTAQVALNDPVYADPRRLVRVAAAIVDRLRVSPGIEVATLVNYPPLATIRVGVPVMVDGDAAAPGLRTPVARYFVIAPDYFRAAGIPLVLGRDFTPRDDIDHQPIAIVSERFARRFWNTTDVIGRRVMARFPPSDAFWIPRARGGWLTVVGVARDVNEDGIPDSAGFPQLYLPYAQAPTPVATVVARTTGAPPETAAPAIRAAVRATDARLPVSYEMTYDEVIRETFSRPREMAWIIGTFAALALLLSAVGVYGVMSFVTAARTREIGIRIALGARRSDIVALVVGQALKLTIVGCAIGVIATPAALQLLRDWLFGVGAFDPWTLSAVAIALAMISTAAAAIPAIRAARRGQLTVLRE